MAKESNSAGNFAGDPKRGGEGPDPTLRAQQGGSVNSIGQSRGGSGNTAKDPKPTSDADRKGGHMPHPQPPESNDAEPSQQGGSGKSSGQSRGGTGNFANDPERAKDAGRKGGQQSHPGSDSSESSQRRGPGTGTGPGSSGGQSRGGTGNHPEDPERASESNRKGGSEPTHRGR